MKISIITVCLNSEKTIEQTITSVLQQDYDNVEYIIVDGKSTDGTLDIINKYKAHITKSISEPDEGLYYAMNKGISMATGEIIGIINSDDWYEANIFSKILQIFQEENIGVVYGRTNMIEDNQISYVQMPENLEKLHYQSAFMHASAFVKREIYEKYGCFDTKYQIAADCDLLLRLYTNGVQFKNAGEIIANYRLDGLSAQREEQGFKEFLEIKYKYLSNLPHKRRKDVEEILCFQRQEHLFIQKLKNELSDFSDIKEMAKNYQVAIWGVGDWGKKLCDKLIKMNIVPECFFDNNKNKWGTYYEGVKVEGITYLESFQGIVIVAVRLESEKIVNEILQLGNKDIRCIGWKELIN